MQNVDQNQSIVEEKQSEILQGGERDIRKAFMSLVKISDPTESSVPVESSVPAQNEASKNCNDFMESINRRQVNVKKVEKPLTYMEKLMSTLKSCSTGKQHMANQKIIDSLSWLKSEKINRSDIEYNPSILNKIQNLSISSKVHKQYKGYLKMLYKKYSNILYPKLQKKQKSTNQKNESEVRLQNSQNNEKDDGNDKDYELDTGTKNDVDMEVDQEKQP